MLIAAIIPILIGQATPDVQVVLPVLITVVSIVIIFFVFIARIVKCGPNEVLVVSGGFGRRKITDATGLESKRGFRIVKGGATFFFPFIQKIDRLSLEIMTLDVRTPEVYTIKGVPVLVDGIAQIKIKGDDVSINTAAEQFLSMSIQQIAKIALQTVEGHLRAILGTLTVEEIYSQRDLFATKVQEIAAEDLANMGMTIVSFTIRDIRDNEGYLDALGKPRTAQVKRDAIIGQAEADRDSVIRSAEAKKEGETARFGAETNIAEAERDYQMRVAEYTADVNQKKAVADLAYDLQKFETAQAVKEQEIQVQVIEKEKQIDVQEKEIMRKQKELSATIEKPAEAEKYKINTLADAERYQLKITAEGAADSTKLRGFAEADVVRAQGEGEGDARKAVGLADADVIQAQGFATAEAMQKKADAWRNYNEAAVIQMFIDKLPEIAKAVSEPLAKTDRIVIINSGGEGGGASKVTKDVTDIIAQLPPVLESLTGMDLEQLLKKLPALKGGFKKDDPVE
ncbi:flotillin family protein [bacterium]|nr:flotillin family protein [bacterium]